MIVTLKIQLIILKDKNKKNVNAILFYNLQTISIIANQMDKFGACDKNEENLQ